MSRVWFQQALETVATFWRIHRRDGLTFGFISHDRDMWLDGVLHRAAPGVVPSAIRRSGGLDADSAEVSGVLTHDGISAQDLAAGKFDGARVRIGLVDWETTEREIIWVGTLGGVTQEDGGFTAELASRKVELLQDQVPRTSPACRAVFCGPGCHLNPVFFTHEATVATVDGEDGTLVLIAPVAPERLAGGTLRWIDGAHAGETMQIRRADAEGAVMLDRPVSHPVEGQRVIVREGCDHSLGTCSTRFANAANFRGEPFLPGNDLLARYPVPAT